MYIRVFPNYTKLAVLAIKAYVGKSKIDSAKKLPPVGIEPGTFWVLFWFSFIQNQVYSNKSIAVVNSKTGHQFW